MRGVFLLEGWESTFPRGWMDRGERSSALITRPFWQAGTELKPPSIGSTIFLPASTLSQQTRHRIRTAFMWSIVVPRFQRQGPQSMYEPFIRLRLTYPTLLPLFSSLVKKLEGRTFRYVRVR